MLIALGYGWMGIQNSIRNIISIASSLKLKSLKAWSIGFWAAAPEFSFLILVFAIIDTWKLDFIYYMTFLPWLAFLVLMVIESKKIKNKNNHVYINKKELAVMIISSTFLFAYMLLTTFLCNKDLKILEMFLWIFPFLFLCFNKILVSKTKNDFTIN